MALKEKSVAISHELINVAQVTCLLTITMIEGQGTPYWFIERLLSKDAAGGSIEPDEEAADQPLARLERDITPLSRYLLKTYEVLDACDRQVQDLPLSQREQIWLLGRMQDLVPRVYEASSAAEREQSPLRIIGLLVKIVQVIGNILVRTLPDRIAVGTLHDLQEAVHGVAALYQAIGYASQEQRDVLTSELELLVPVIADIEQRLRETLNS